MNKFIWFVCAVLVAGCASEGRGLVPGKSTVAEVEKAMGPAADKRPGAGGETVYYFPRLPWGYVTYAARIAPDGRLVAPVEQRLTQANVEKLKVNETRAGEVRDLLGPPYEPMKMPFKDAEIWTYPMRVPGFPTPRWLLVQITSDGVVRDVYSINDPHYNTPDSPRCC